MKNRIKVGIIKEEDIKPVFMEFDDTDEGVEQLTEFISPTGNVTIVDMTPFGLDNTVVMFDNDSVINPGEYNMALQIMPMFGTICFAEIGVSGNDQKVVSMHRGLQEKVIEMVSKQKQMEIDSGARKDIIAKVSVMGKQNYLREIDQYLMDNSAEGVYEEARREQE